MSSDSRFFKAVLLQFTGTVGAGIFSLPFALTHSNFTISAIFLVFFGLLTAFVNWIYLDIILVTRGDHQLPGYSQIFLGRRFRNLAVLNIFILATGALMAYLTLSAQFLISFFPGLNPFIASSIFFFAVAVFFLFRFTNIGFIATVLPGLVVFIPLLLFYFTYQLPLPPIPTYPFSLSFLGPVFFALSSFTVVPEVEEAMRGIKPRLLIRLASSFGTLLVIFIYLIFSYSIAKLSGPHLSTDTITGLITASPVLSKLLSVFGLLAIFNVSLNFLTILKEIFYRDLKLKQNLSYGLALCVPLFSLLFAKVPFAQIISITGSITVVISVILIILIRFKLNSSFMFKILTSLVLFTFIFGLYAEFFL